MENARRARSNRVMFSAIVVLVILWLVAMAYRNQIRAHVWVYRLRAAKDQAGQAQYLARLASLGNEAVPAVRSLLADGDAAVRSQGLAVLNHASSDDARQMILQATRDRDEWIRESAVRSLTAKGDVDSLIEILRRDDTVSACAAADGLATLGARRAIPALIQQLQLGRPTAVRVGAIEALAQLNAAEAIPALQNCLEDQTPFDSLTLSERSAQKALRAARPELGIEWPAGRTIADFAQKAIQRIQPESLGPERE